MDKLDKKIENFAREFEVKKKKIKWRDAWVA